MATMARARRCFIITVHAFSITNNNYYNTVHGIIGEEMSEIQLMKMTKNQLFDLLSGHGKKVSNKSILKGDLVKLIIREGFNKPHDDD